MAKGTKTTAAVATQRKPRKERSPRDPSMKYIIGALTETGELGKSYHEEWTVRRAFRQIPLLAKVLAVAPATLAVFRIKRVSEPLPRQPKAAKGGQK